MMMPLLLRLVLRNNGIFLQGWVREEKGKMKDIDPSRFVLGSVLIEAVSWRNGL